jgi:hypothetical protein
VYIFHSFANYLDSFVNYLDTELKTLESRELHT